MVRDCRNRKSPWIKGVIQDRSGPVTYRVQVGDLLCKCQVDQLRSLAGSKVADTESLSEVPEVGHTRDPEVVQLSQPQRSEIESDTAKAPDAVDEKETTNAPNIVPETEGSDLSTSPPESTNLPSVPAEVQKHLLTRQNQDVIPQGCALIRSV